MGAHCKRNEAKCNSNNYKSRHLMKPRAGKWQNPKSYVICVYFLPLKKLEIVSLTSLHVLVPCMFEPSGVKEMAGRMNFPSNPCQAFASQLLRGFGPDGTIPISCAWTWAPCLSKSKKTPQNDIQIYKIIPSKIKKNIIIIRWLSLLSS